MNSLLDNMDPTVNETSHFASKNDSVVLPGIVSPQLTFAFTVLNYVILCQAIALFGVVSNIINMVVFLRLGFADTINISLFGLAVSDLILQLMTLLVCIAFNPWFEAAFQRGDVLYFMGGWIQVTTTRITGWITAFVTLERCLCVALPLKVKDIISPARAAGVIVSILVVSTLCMIPVYWTTAIGWTLDPKQNKSLLTLVNLESRRDLQNAMFYLNNVVLAFVTFTLIIVGSTYLSLAVSRTSRWRSQFSSNMDDNTTKVRDRKVVKMVAVIAVVYVVCYTPTIVVFIWMVEDADFSVTGRYRNLFLLLSSVAFLFESINSSFNIFIYFKMSSKYKATFRSLWSWKKKS